MSKSTIIKITVLIGLIIVAMTLINIKDSNAQKQKEINSEEFNRLDGNILSIKIIDNGRIETNVEIYVKKDRILHDVIEEFFYIETTTNGDITKIKHIESIWNVFVNGELVNINEYTPSDKDEILITNK